MSIDKEKIQQGVLNEIELRRAEIQRLQSELTAFMDAQMPLFAKFNVGDEIFDREGCRLGTVSKLYRYWANHQRPDLDTSMSIHYEFQVADRCFDNTSRFGGASFYTREEIAKRFEDRAASIRRMYGYG